jgi:hypothetical protein
MSEVATTNEAGTVNGGIPSLLRAGRTRPAATDPGC